MLCSCHRMPIDVCEWRNTATMFFATLWQEGLMTELDARKWLWWRMGYDIFSSEFIPTVQQCKQAVTEIMYYRLTIGEFIICPDCGGSGDAGDPLDITDYNPCVRCDGDGKVQRGDYYRRRVQ